MELLETETFSDEQKFICKCRVEEKTCKEAIQLVNEKYHKQIYPKKISSCVMRSALGYEWHFDMSAGPKPYLCSADLQDLRETIDELCSIGTSMDANNVIEEAYRLKTARILKAILFLSNTKSYFSVDQIRENLNIFLRLESCSFDTIHSFFSQFEHLPQIKLCLKKY